MIFTNATLLGVSQESVFLGERIARIRTVKTMSIDGFIESRFVNLDNVGVAETINHIKTEVSKVSGTSALSQDLIEDIIINDINFGKGKITSLNYKASPGTLENQIFWGSYSATIEIYIEGTLSEIFHLQNKNIDNEFSLEFLEDFSEDFSFSISEDGSYDGNHNVSFKFVQNEANLNIINQSQSLANEIFSRTPLAFDGLLNGHFASIFSPGKRFFTESYDLENNEFSFSKKYKAYQNLKDGYTSSVRTSFSFDENGIIKITEDGTIKHNDYILNDALDSLSAELVTSFSRCNAVYNAYKSVFSPNNNLLKNQYIELSKTINNNTGEVEYSVSYTDEASFESLLYFEEIETSLAPDENGISFQSVSIKRNYNGEKGSIPVWAPFSNYQTLASQTALSLYQRNGGALPLNLIKSSFSLTYLAKEFSSSFEFSDDVKKFPTRQINWPLLAGREIINEEEISIDTEVGVPITKNFTIPNGVAFTGASGPIPDEWRQLVHYPNQTSLSKASIKGSFKLKRQPYVNGLLNISEIRNNLRDIIALAFIQMKVLLINNYISKNTTSYDPGEFIITSFSYSFDSEGALSVSISAEHPTIASGLQRLRIYT